MKAAFCCYGLTGVPGVRAAIDGNSRDFEVHDVSTWVSHSQTFVAAGATAVLEFSTQRDGDRDAAFDNIALSQVSGVPEPATALLLGAKRIRRSIA